MAHTECQFSGVYSCLFAFMLICKKIKRDIDLLRVKVPATVPAPRNQENLSNARPQLTVRLFRVHQLVGGFYGSVAF